MNPNRRLRVLVVDDQEVVQWGMKLLLTREPWVERCLVAASPEHALELARRYKPHVALVEVLLGGESGVDLVRRLTEIDSGMPVLLTSAIGQMSRRAATAAGARGFIPKDGRASHILRAVRMAGLGRRVFASRAAPSRARLSEREREVLGMMASGATNREIAEQLVLSPNTVKDHTVALYRKIEVRNRTQAIAKAQRLGLVA